MRTGPKKETGGVPNRPFGAKLAVSLVAGIALGVVGFALGWLALATYGGNSCDVPPQMTCDCFCCNMLSLRGYESCGKLGAYAGGAVGLALGAFAAFSLQGRTRRS